MQTIKNTELIVELVDFNNYYFQGNQFDSLLELENYACSYFNDITEDYEDRGEYYKSFGVDLNDCIINKIRVEKYFNEEYNDITTVEFYEGYIDSGVDEVDYFHGYIIKN